MAGALVSLMAMAVGGRELSSHLGTFEILFFRSLIGLAIILLVLRGRLRGHVSTRRVGLHVLRNFAHFAGQYGWFYGVALIPLAEVFAIEFTVPIWTLLLGTLLVGERLSGTRVAAVALGIIGTVVILRPGAVPTNPAAIAVLGAAIGFALSHTLTKKLISTDSPISVIFYMTVIQLPLGLVPALGHWVTPEPALWPWLAVIGFTGLSAHYCTARALALADAMVVVPLDFLRLPLIAVVGFLVYDEQLSGFVLAGAILMLAGNLLNVRAERASTA
jgi:drug/metabolite transporter (DMT)-like permease